MLVINQQEVEELLPMSSCIALMEEVLIELSKGTAVQHLRSVIPLQQGNLMGLMPGLLKSEEVAGAKIITISPENHEKGLPSHQGVVLLFDSEDGSLKATVDGRSITAIRTAAVSGVATNYLANEDAEVLSLLGTGEQARTHLEAMLLVRPFKKVKVWSRNSEKAQIFQKEMEQTFDVDIEVAVSPKEAVDKADVICTLTASSTPILKAEWVKDGAHINAVGACRPSDRELDSMLVKKSLFFTDRVESAMNEAGDLLIPLQEGIVQPEHLLGEIGDVLMGKIPGRRGPAHITIFESLGLAIEDIMSAQFIYKEGIRLNKGILVPMGGEKND